MSDYKPELPAAYELVEFDSVSCIKSAAARLAINGAEEGTLVWAKKQQNGIGRLGSNWYSKPGDLHCSIILRPDFPAERYPELLLIGTVSMGNALATHVSPMTALGYAWPNKITIATHTVANVWVEFDQRDPAWLTISCSANLLDTPDDLSIPAISVLEAEGTSDINSGVLLESFARQFITLINQWSEEGMSSIVNKWRLRAGGTGKDTTLYTHRGSFSGSIKAITDRGTLEVVSEAKENLNFRLSEFIEESQINQ
jgi:BirA family biotin operon repressor/biotin-[acetyl-CoA-carboxylase] ligase